MKERIFSLTTLFDYIEEYFPTLIFWDGFSKHGPREKNKNYKHRACMPNEIRIEFDSKDIEQNWKDINETAINLWKSKYSFAIFSVKGGRGPHIHLYDCDELENYSIEMREFYRRKFLKKYCPKGSEPDIELCNEKHLCALEFVPHFKHKNPKELLSFFDNGPLSNQGMENEIWEEIVFGKKTPEKRKKLLVKKRVKFGDRLKQSKRELIISYLNFEAVLDKYKIKYKGKMAVCPFHSYLGPLPPGARQVFGQNFLPSGSEYLNLVERCFSLY